MRQRRFTSNLLRRTFDAIPGKKTLGMYRFLPAFFFMGAALEFSMIKWTVGETNFYRVYKKRQATNLLEAEEGRE